MTSDRPGGRDGDAPAAPWWNRHERWLWGAVALAGAAALLPTLTPGVVGLFHDDAIYASGAKSLAEGGGYRLPNLPDAPFQTKYPPLYPALLAIAWWIHPAFPANVVFLKALNIAFVAAAVFGIALLGRAQNQKTSWAVLIACQLVLLTNPMLVGFSDYTMTDVLFTTLVVYIVLLWGRSGAATSLPREWAVAGVSVVAILTRSVGIALSAAITIDCLLRGQRARAMAHGGAGLAALSAWMLWASMHRADSSPLTDYFLEYERPAFSYLMTEPRLAAQIIVGNIRLMGDSMFTVMGLSWILLWPVLLAFLTVGAVQIARSGWRMPFLFSGCYLALVVSHPFAPFRYLLPLAPLCVVCTAVGATHLWAVVKGSRVAFERPASVPALLVLTVLLAGNGAWLRNRFEPGVSVRFWTGSDTGYHWSGFEETFEWVRRSTPQQARLGAFFDTMYALYTGRQAVRPWFHRSETYFYPYGAPEPFVGRPEDVARELRELGIDYLVLDPPRGYSEGAAAIALLRGVVALPRVKAHLVFKSSDGFHEVYKLWYTP